MEHKLPYDAALRDDRVLVRGRHGGHPNWAMLIQRTAFWLDYRKFEPGVRADEHLFFMTLMPWVYAYGKINQGARLQVRKAVFYNTQWRGTRNQKYFVRMPLPVVLAANYEMLNPTIRIKFPYPAPQRPLNDILEDPNLRNACILGTRSQWGGPEARYQGG
jgi:hypothetical protein